MKMRLSYRRHKLFFFLAVESCKRKSLRFFGSFGAVPSPETPSGRAKDGFVLLSEPVPKTLVFFSKEHPRFCSRSFLQRAVERRTSGIRLSQFSIPFLMLESQHIRTVTLRRARCPSLTGISFLPNRTRRPPPNRSNRSSLMIPSLFPRTRGFLPGDELDAGSAKVAKIYYLGLSQEPAPTT